MSEFAFRPEEISPAELLMPYAERIVEEADFEATTQLSEYEKETLDALYSFAGALGLRGREYIVQAQPLVVLVSAGKDEVVYLPAGENEYIGRLLTYEIKKIEQPDFRLYEVGLYLEGVRFCQGDDEEGIEELLGEGDAEMFVPVLPGNSLITIHPRPGL